MLHTMIISMKGNGNSKYTGGTVGTGRKTTLQPHIENFNFC